MFAVVWGVGDTDQEWGIQLCNLSERKQLKVGVRQQRNCDCALGVCVRSVCIGLGSSQEDRGKRRSSCREATESCDNKNVCDLLINSTDEEGSPVSLLPESPAHSRHTGTGA